MRIFRHEGKARIRITYCFEQDIFLIHGTRTQRFLITYNPHSNFRNKLLRFRFQNIITGVLCYTGHRAIIFFYLYYGAPARVYTLLEQHAFGVVVSLHNISNVHSPSMLANKDQFIFWSKMHPQGKNVPICHRLVLCQLHDSDEIITVRDPVAIFSLCGRQTLFADSLNDDIYVYSRLKMAIYLLAKKSEYKKPRKVATFRSSHLRCPAFDQLHGAILFMLSKRTMRGQRIKILLYRVTLGGSGVTNQTIVPGFRFFSKNVAFGVIGTDPYGFLIFSNTTDVVQDTTIFLFRLVT
jgi:hypothetical protein